MASVALLAVVALPAGANHIQAAGGKAVAFDHKTGNEWWVEVLLGGSSAASVAKVEAMDTGGAWVVLPKKSWGAYAASFHIEPGHLVKFRAAWSDGAVVESCWFTHPAGAEQCSTAPPPPPPPPGSFAVTFSNVKGNEWWVEAKASGNKAIAQVDARANGGDWRPLALRDWGSWAASFNIPAGSHVQLRAKATDGSYGFAPNGWTWTAATPYPPASTALDARFENLKGNANWVQVNVYASPNWGLQGVSFRVDGGAWKPLARQSYGDWTASPPVPDGGLVQFRAEAGGHSVLSGTYRWPTATPVPAWPVVGSYAVYDVGGSGGSPAGDVYSEYWGKVTFRYTSAGAWQATCDLTRHHHSDYEVPADTYTTVQETKALAPPAWPANVAAGQRVEGQGVGDCALTSLTVDVVGETVYTTKQSGMGTMAPAWDGYLDDCGCRAFDADWARHHGLFLRGSFSGLGGGHHAALLDTDAPIR